MNPLNLLAELVIGLAEAACELAIAKLEMSDDFAARVIASAARSALTRSPVRYPLEMLLLNTLYGKLGRRAVDTTPLITAMNLALNVLPLTR